MRWSRAASGGGRKRSESASTAGAGAEILMAAGVAIVPVGAGPRRPVALVQGQGPDRLRGQAGSGSA